MSPSFLEIPDLPMEMIMNNLDYIAIQSVRKTCWGLRNFIDDKKPGIGIKQISICQMDNTAVRLAINLPSSYYYLAPSSELPKAGFILKYEKHENGCRISVTTSDGNKTKYVKNFNFLNAAFHDFKVALNTQKAIFKHVEVTGKTFFEKFEKVMKSQKPIATESMEINVNVNFLKRARQILQHADPKYLKSIEYFKEPIRILETVKLESSKNIQNFSHFSSISIQSKKLDVDSIRAIKENFFQFHEYNKHLLVLAVVQENLFIDAFGATFEPPGEMEGYVIRD
ncbi:hypothetical protein GCK72_021377 [Caenorhabditis remanei]|uniref:F-box domain-containing protein n=1 Tax=Caenorhabditis remanei TaxID=31234 RepID=A0A6A5GJE4_CAERE|nr:hypothetical protein GCK72_021377 [Caenorhabditis remanei]KAF1754813.1 hypothetical protein GCK72_021377 [Caenorhabditis remanei]